MTSSSKADDQKIHNQNFDDFIFPPKTINLKNSERTFFSFFKVLLIHQILYDIQVTKL